MLSSIFCGEIRSDKLKSWSENKDPYKILVENNRVYKLGRWDLIAIADKLFDNEKQVIVAQLSRQKSEIFIMN